MKRITWINLILGIWMIISPFLIGYSVSYVPTGNNIVLGVLLIASSWWILAALMQTTGMSWFQVLCGIWLIIAPFVLNYRAMSQAMSNDVIVGIIVLIVGLVETQVGSHRPVRAA